MNLPSHCPDCGRSLAEPPRPLGHLGRHPVWCATCDTVRTSTARCCPPHDLTVEHHYAARASFARCTTCGATARPLHWLTADNPPNSDAVARANFHVEYGHD